MKTPEYFISCDWGTSNFRLKLVKSESLQIIKEIATNKGIKVLYDAFLKQQKLNQTDFFADYLLSQVQLFPKEHQNSIIVSSGMITANIGLYEMSYSDMPFKDDGSSLNSKKIEFKNGLEILLISGVKNEQGMMRGEETQAIGLANYLDVSKENLLLLPGTHSKHITYKNGKFLDLKNFMTGELFEIISQKSILSNSILKTEKIIDNTFIEGVKFGSQGKLTSNLFSIRANDLLGKCTKEENYYFLSGLLIGDELSYLKNAKEKVFLACPYPLATLYKMALDHIIGSEKYVLFDAKTTEKSILIGQKKILTQI